MMTPAFAFFAFRFPFAHFLGGGGGQHLYIIAKMSPSEPEQAVGALDSARSLRVKQKAVISRIDVSNE